MPSEADRVQVKVWSYTVLCQLAETLSRRLCATQGAERVGVKERRQAVLIEVEARFEDGRDA